MASALIKIHLFNVTKKEMPPPRIVLEDWVIQNVSTADTMANYPGQIPP